MQRATCRKARAHLLIILLSALSSQVQRMKELVTRQERIDDFIHEGSPPNDQPLQILCEDHVGAYVISFPCRWREGIWENAKTSRRIEARLVGGLLTKLGAELSGFQLTFYLCSKPPRIRRPVPH